MNWRRIVKRFFGSRKIIVLMYHRVAELEADPWQLAVSPAKFEAQLKLLKKKYRVITPQELLEQVNRKSIRRKQVCITFDDGYRDNYAVAKPLLEKYGLPATFFITTYALQKKQSYWWDELQEIIFFTPKLPSPFAFEISGTKINCELDNNGLLTEEQRVKQKAWVWSDEAPTQRCKLYFLLWERMRPLSQAEIETLLASLKAMMGIEDVIIKGSPPMTMMELKELSDSKHLQIGLHTHTHPSLSDHDLAFQQSELIDNKNMLETVCNYSVTILSYPHGRFNEDTLSLAKKLKLDLAFTTQGHPVTKESLPYQFGRYQVLNWKADQFDNFLRKLFN